MPDGVRPPESNKDQAIAYAILTETGGANDKSSPVYDGDGKFVGWDTNYRDGTSFRHGFAGRTEVDAGGDKGAIGWARLVGGTKVLGFARGPESGDHFVWGVQPTNVPTTGVRYTIWSALRIRRCATIVWPPVPLPANCRSRFRAMAASSD